MDHFERQVRAFHHTPWAHRSLKSFLEATGATLARYVEVNARIQKKKFRQLRQEFWLMHWPIRRLLKRISPREEILIHDPHKNDYAWAIWIRRSNNGNYFQIRSTDEEVQMRQVDFEEAVKLISMLLREFLPHPHDEATAKE